MSASPLQFNPWIQEPLEAGCLAPQTAWAYSLELQQLETCHWSMSAVVELEKTELNRWSRAVFPIVQTLALYHWSPEFSLMQ